MWRRDISYRLEFVEGLWGRRQWSKTTASAKPRGGGSVSGASTPIRLLTRKTYLSPFL